MCHLRVETQFPAALHSPGPEPGWFSRPVKGIHLHRAGCHVPGAQMPHFYGVYLSLWFPFLLWVTCWSCGSSLDCFSFPPTHLAVFPSLYLSCISFFASLPVLLVNNSFGNSYSFGVPIGGGKLRVFLLLHTTGHAFVECIFDQPF